MEDIVSTFLGAFLGIPAGFILNHFWEKRSESARRKQLCIGLKESLEKNAYLVDQIKSWLIDAKGIPTFNVDPTLLESTASLKYELIDDLVLCKEVDNVRYELGHLSRKLDMLLSIEMNPSARFATDGPGGSVYNAIRPRLLEALRMHLAPLQEALGRVKSKLSDAE